MSLVKKSLIHNTIFSIFLLLASPAFTSDKEQENKEEKESISKEKKRKKRTSDIASTSLSIFSTPSSHRNNPDVKNLSKAQRVSPSLENNPFIKRDQEIRKLSPEGISPDKKKTRKTSPYRTPEKLTSDFSIVTPPNRPDLSRSNPANIHLKGSWTSFYTQTNLFDSNFNETDGATSDSQIIPENYLPLNQESVDIPSDQNMSIDDMTDKQIEEMLTEFNFSFSPLKENKPKSVEVIPKKVQQNLYDKFLDEQRSNFYYFDLIYAGIFPGNKKVPGRRKYSRIEHVTTIHDISSFVVALSSFSMKDVAHISQVSKGWYIIARDPRLWFLNRLKDSRRPIKQLSYSYQNETFDHTPWIDSYLPLVKSFGPKFQTVCRENKNTALAQISFIYQVSDPKTNQTFVHQWCFQIPHLFISGWGSGSQRNNFDKFIREIMTNYRTEFKQIEAYTRFQMKDTESDWDSYKDYMSHLIYSDKCQLIPQQTQNDLNLMKTDLAHRFFHSEQAIAFYFYKKMTNYISKFISEVSTKHKGMKVTLLREILDILSYQDMCQRCGNRLFYEIERTSKSKQSDKYIFNLEKTLKAKSIELDSDFKYFIASSGTTQYRDDDGKYLRDYDPDIMIPMQNIDLKTHNNFVAQYYHKEKTDESK